MCTYTPPNPWSVFSLPCLNSLVPALARQAMVRCSSTADMSGGQALAPCPRAERLPRRPKLAQDPLPRASRRGGLQTTSRATQGPPGWCNSPAAAPLGSCFSLCLRCLTLDLPSRRKGWPSWRRPRRPRFQPGTQRQSFETARVRLCMLLVASWPDERSLGCTCGCCPRALSLGRVTGRPVDHTHTGCQLMVLAPTVDDGRPRIWYGGGQAFVRPFLSLICGDGLRPRSFSHPSLDITVPLCGQAAKTCWIWGGGYSWSGG